MLRCSLIRALSNSSQFTAVWLLICNVALLPTQQSNLKMASGIVDPMNVRSSWVFFLCVKDAEPC